ncbi:MAG TPA: regulatory iron-sulfur-containing complex subunit RicT [Candidatus Eisenbacteria bacterium]|nr:regulatory iron-sulfur-containing complex subunit RicT [Candidatus Eisenbacteria bacterium]
MNEPLAAAGAVADPKQPPAEAHEILEVIFKARRREYYANPKEVPLRGGDWIVVQAERGEDLGKVHHTHEWVKRDHLPGNLRAVIRQARPEDLERLEQNRAKEERAFQTCKERVLQREIEMKLVDCEYQFDGNRITFFFTAEKRVDFRDLVKDLAAVFRTRIELRQIGVRDESGRIGGMGTCGRELCCATWLRDFEPITLKMAKDQGLSPSPSKISGACGRLKCCLRYELDFYKGAAREFPKIGSALELEGVAYEVGRVDIFHRTLTLHDEAGNPNVVLLDELPAGTKVTGPSRDRRKGCDKQGCGSRGAKPGDGGHDDAHGGGTATTERPGGPGGRPERGGSRDPRRSVGRPQRHDSRPAPPPRGERPGADSPRSDASPGASPRNDQPANDTARGDAARNDAARSDAPPSATPRFAAPRADAPREAQPPRQEYPRPAGPRAEQPGGAQAGGSERRRGRRRRRGGPGGGRGPGPGPSGGGNPGGGNSGGGNSGGGSPGGPSNAGPSA